MDEGHTKPTTLIYRGEYYRTGEGGGGGLRTAAEDRQRLITAEHDGETEVRK